jgi:hypothetical protein
MLITLMIVIIGAVGYLSAAAARERRAPLHSMLTTALRVAVGIAVVRLVILYSGSSLLGSVHKSRPIVFILLAVNSALESEVTTAWYGAQPWPDASAFIAVLISLTSGLLGFSWAWIRSRPRSGTAT